MFLGTKALKTFKCFLEYILYVVSILGECPLKIKARGWNDPCDFGGSLKNILQKNQSSLQNVP